MLTTSRIRGAALAALAVVTLSACGGTFEVVSRRPLPEDKAPKGIVVFPVAVMIPGSTPLEYVARADEVANWLLRRTEVPVVGPLDYKLFRAPDEARVASTATDLMSRDRDRVDLRGWAALAVLITENRAMNVRDIIDNRKNAKKKGQIYRQQGVEATVRVELRLYDAMRGKMLAEAVVKDIDDPTALSQEGDPRPGIHKLLDRGLALLFEDAAPLLEASPRRRVRSGFVAAVPRFATYAVVGKASYMDKFRDKDDTDKQAAMISLWDRFHPGLPVKVTYVAGKNPGLLVLEERAPLKRYDLVLAVGGKPVYAMHQLDRRLDACGMAGCEVQIRRGFKDIKVHVNWPAVPKIAD